MTRLQSHSLDRIKSKTRRLRLLHFAQRKSTSTTQQLHAASPQSIGQHASNDGTSAQSSMARIIRPPCVRSQKHGAKFSAVSVPRSCLRFFLTKIYAQFVKRLCRLATLLYCQKFEANARLHQK